MSENNKHNLLYFESDSMKDLYATMNEWQNTNKKRLLSTNIQKDNDKFCCIALTNPTEVIITNTTEVIICDGKAYGGAQIYDNQLAVIQKPMNVESDLLPIIQRLDFLIQNLTPTD